MTAEATRCISALDERQQDITMLWLLKEPRWLEEFRMGMDLLDWARNIMKVPFAVCRGEAFQQEVSRVFKERGIRPVAPERRVDSWKKDFAKDKCLSAKWPKPFLPTMLQTRPRADVDKAGAFIVFSSWQDAMIALRRIAETKTYTGSGGRVYPADMVFENQVVDMSGYDYPCRIILDCDAKLKEFDSKYSIEELCRSIDCVPEFFARRLIEIGAIRDTDEITVYEKEKSRPGKASRHYILNIMARSTWETQKVLGIIFGDELEKAKQQSSEADALLEAADNDGDDGHELSKNKKKKKKTAQPDAIPEPWRVTDTVPHHGRGQYSVLGFFDEKKGETEFPCLSRLWKIVGGKTVSLRPCNVSRAESSLKHPLALQMLHKTCYSCLPDKFITLDKKFMMQKQVFMLFYCWYQPAASLELTHAPQTVAGKKRAGRGLQRWNQQQRCPWRPPIPERREPVVPAAMGPISDFQDHGERRWGLLSQHEHALLNPHTRAALPTRGWHQEGECGPHLPCVFLSLLGVQRGDQDPREQWHVCGDGGGGQGGLC